MFKVLHKVFIHPQVIFLGCKFGYLVEGDVGIIHCRSDSITNMNWHQYVRANLLQHVQL